MCGMAGEPHLLLFGASVRAAAFSALRAGLRPWCADLFADTDLRACCPALALPAADYPEGYVEVCARAPEGPWMYTGGLENRPALVEKLCRLRPLWGNGPDVLRRVRSPAPVAERLTRTGIACPEVRLNTIAIPKRGRWLVKPRDGTGGRGIAFVEDWAAVSRRRHVYFQEYIEGEPCSAVYLGWVRRLSDRSVVGASFLEATRQLIGVPWLHGAPFHYCGSIGPLPLPLPVWRKFHRIGTILAKTCGLRGLFGVDCILRDGVPWAVEVNPRYPASVEVLEEPGGPSAVALHRAALEGADVPLYWGSGEPQQYLHAKARGKAILFARESLAFPEDPFWTARAYEFRPDQPGRLLFADIPPAGQRIERGRPILTFFAEGATVDKCQERLRATAADLDRRLFDR
jgi:predicted ATP-grasp superfamily ATP-dependent carboligase